MARARRTRVPTGNRIKRAGSRAGLRYHGVKYRGKRVYVRDGLGRFSRTAGKGKSRAKRVAAATGGVALAATAVAVAASSRPTHIRPGVGLRTNPITTPARPVLLPGGKRIARKRVMPAAGRKVG